MAPDRQPRLYPDPWALAKARGALFAAAPAALTIAAWWHGPLALSWPWLLGLLSACLLALTGRLLAEPDPRALRTGAAGLVGGSLVGGEHLFDSPAWVLFGLCLVALAWFGVSRAITCRPGLADATREPEGYRAQSARSAALVALALWLVGVLSGNGPDTEATAAVGLLLTVLVPVGLSLRWAWSARRAAPSRAVTLLAGVVLAALLAFALPPGVGRGPLETPSYLAAVLLAASLLVLPVRSAGDGGGSLWDPILHHPDRLLAATFAGLILFGTLLLALPNASTSGYGIPLDAAAFTAVSAVCVTGLSVLDTAKDFTPFGQAVILFLIQLGGLGIMTFSTAAIGFFGRRVSLRQEGVMARIANVEDRGGLSRAMGQLISFTLIVEAIGAALLFISFLVRGLDVGPAAWHAVFTSISAFCNAGFFMDGASLVPWQAAPEILHIVGLLIICGGLSPLAVLAVPKLWRGRRVALQARAILLTSASLLLVGFIAFLVFEWNGALADLTPADRFHNAWFQSVTLRTAGFNSIDLAATGPVTYLFMLVLMFVGGSPGSTAGGARTTTLLVLVLAVVAVVRNRRSVSFSGHAIGATTIFKAAAIVTVMGTLVFGATMALLLTQDLGLRLALYEVVSAMATVGLTLGATAELDTVGRVIIMACMFIGRIGAMSLLLFLAQGDGRDEPRWKLPEGQIQVI